MSVIDDTTAAGLDGIDPLRVVDPHVYLNEAVFLAEQEHIFARTWTFVCHESELAQSGSFVTADVAESPILVARNQAGELRAFHNACRHRGAQITTDEAGVCRQFRCSYHWWVYDLDGTLVGVPGAEAYDYDNSGFDKERLGLVPVRVDASHGLVFVCLDPDVPPLSDFLGTSEDVLRRVLGGGEYEVIKHVKYPLHANWKLFPENSRDGYHVPFVHPFFRQASPPRHYSLLSNGHAVQYLGVDQGDMPDDLFNRLRAHTLPGLEPNEGLALQIWPHLLVFVRNNFVLIESVHPVSAGETAMESRVLGVAGDDPEVTEERLFAWETWANSQNRNEDVPIIEQQQRGLRSRGLPLVLINRGSDNPEGVRGDDNRLRHFWAKWREEVGTDLNSLEPSFRPAL